MGDLTALEYTREHYNRHVKYVDTWEAEQVRQSGPSLPLKKFHNEIKRRLLLRFAKKAPMLLDLACGRGGDVWKWIDAEVEYVKGIDLSPAEVEEAARRFSEALRKRKGCSLTADFECSDQLGQQRWDEGVQYDVATCMFAIHYFFDREDTLKQFLENVAINLKDGGYFIGTVPCGKRVLETLNTGGVFHKVFETPMLTLEAKWMGPPQAFGSAYHCSIGDTVTEAHEDMGGSYEFLVYASVLRAVAERYGLQPVVHYGDKELENMFLQADEEQYFKHFNPRFPGSDPSLEIASGLFAAFVFQKVAKEEQGGQQQAQEAAAQRNPQHQGRAENNVASVSGRVEKRGRPDEQAAAPQPRPRHHSPARVHGSPQHDEGQRQPQHSSPQRHDRNPHR